MIRGHTAGRERVWTFLRKLWTPRARLAELLILVTLFSVTVGERAYLASHRQVMHAGDTFNFLFLARSFNQGHLLKGEKRLPLYPLTILVGWKGLGLDPLVAATAVSVLTSGGTTVLLYLLGRRLGVRPLPLALFLLLLVVAPAPNTSGIRPLADSLFVFLVVASVYAVTVTGSSVRAALFQGGLIGSLLLTRYEGLVLAPVLVLLLRLRMPWRRVLLAALPVLFVYAAWVPYNLHVHGAITGGYFEEWGDKEGAVGGKLVDIPQKLWRIAGGIGWSRPWEHAAWAVEQSDGPALPRILGSGAWWVSLLALLGVPWLALIARRTAVPFLGVFFVFSAMYAMWVVYDRFVAPGIPAFYLAAAAGASALFSIIRALWRSPVLRTVAGTALFLGLLWIARKEFPGQFLETRSRIFENEGSGYSLVLGIRELARRDGRVALNHDLMAQIYLGVIDDPLAPPQRAIMLGEASEVESRKALTDRTAEQAEQLQILNVRYLVERGEPRILRILENLQERGVVVRSEEIRFPKGQPPDPKHGGFDVTHIHTLAWISDK